MPVPPEVLTDIFAEIAAGTAAYKAFGARGINPRDFYGTLDADPEAANKYARALASGLDAMADDTLRVADDQTITPEHKRIMVDARKWLLSKRAPKKYGDRMLVGSDPENPIPPLVVIGSVGEQDKG